MSGAYYAPSPVLDDFTPVFSFHPPNDLEGREILCSFYLRKKTKQNKTKQNCGWGIKVTSQGYGH